MDSSKRKHDGDDARSGAKRSKGGSQGRWMTPSHKAKVEALKGRSLELGDAGFWITCQRHKEMKAADEIVALCEEYGKKLFNITPADEVPEGGADDEDIDAAIEREVAALNEKAENGKKKATDAPFDLIRVDIDCVLFMRTRAPVDPLVLVRAICEDAARATDKSMWRSRFLNKLTPVTMSGKATEKGVAELAAKVLKGHFLLEGEEGESEEEACTYAIRPTIRAHNTLERLPLIEQIAGMISKKHKVDLKNPDKVIVIEIFQTFCGMCVVGKDWEAMKRYNMHELYTSATKKAGGFRKNKPAAETEEKKSEKDEKKPEAEEPKLEAEEEKPEANEEKSEEVEQKPESEESKAQETA